MKKVALLFLMAILAAVAMALSIYPSYLLAPPQAHTPEDIAHAFQMRGLAPWLVLAVALLSVFVGVTVWRLPKRPGIFRRVLLGTALVVLMAPLVVAAVISRGTIFERMFASLSEVELESDTASDTLNPVGDDEMVMGISVGGASRAYPIRIVGYHHIVHDTLGGEPVVATY